MEWRYRMTQGLIDNDAMTIEEDRALFLRCCGVTRFSQMCLTFHKAIMFVTNIVTKPFERLLDDTPKEENIK